MNVGLSYREAAVRGASSVGLVILLYEQAIEDLRQALAAHRRGDIEERARQIKHALLVIGQLQSSLNKDEGGKVAINLERFYSQVRAALVEAQCKQSPAALEKQISYLMQLREAWSEVEQAAAPTGTRAASARPFDEPPETAEWKA